MPTETIPDDMKQALDIIKDLYYYFNQNLEHALEAFLEGYTAEELKSKGNFDPYIVYLIWVVPGA